MAAVSKGFGGLMREKHAANGGAGAQADEVCPCFVRDGGGGGGESYAQCCKPYHSGAKQAESAEMLLRSRFAAYSKSQTEYLIRTTAGKDDDEMRTLMNDTVASCKRLRFSDLEVLEAAEHDAQAVIKFRYGVRTVGQKGFRHGDLEPVEETSHFVRTDGRWFFNEGVTDHNPDGAQAARPLDNLKNKPVPEGEDEEAEAEDEAEAVADVEGDAAVDFGSLTVVKLKELLRERGLPVSGRKAELVARLEGGQ